MVKDNKTVLITGASSGIGYEIAKLFVQDNYNLVLVAKDPEKLANASKSLQKDSISITVIATNLADPGSPELIYKKVKSEGIKIDILINNAGFATYGLFYETDLKSELDELQVNIIALTHLTKLFVHDMVKNKSGKILNVASTAAFLPGPLMAVYFASKAYVLSFSEAIANELVGTNVTISVLCPGPTNTGFVKRAQMESSSLFKGKNMSPETVAKTAYIGLMNGKRVIIPGLKNKILVAATRFVPRGIAATAVRITQRK